MNLLWVQKLVDEILRKNIVMTPYCSIFPQISYHHQKNNIFTINKSHRHHPKQAIKANIYVDTN